MTLKTPNEEFKQQSASSSSATDTPKLKHQRSNSMFTQKHDTQLLPAARVALIPQNIKAMRFKEKHLSMPYERAKSEPSEGIWVLKQLLKKVKALRKAQEDSPRPVSSEFFKWFNFGKKNNKETYIYITHYLLFILFYLLCIKENRLPKWFDSEKKKNKTSEVVEAIRLWRIGVQRILDKDYEGATKSLKKAVRQLDDADTYTKEIDLNLLKANIFMDMSIVGFREHNRYRQTECLRQAESILLNIAVPDNDPHWGPAVTMMKGSTWFELGLCFGDVNTALALSYDIKFAQALLLNSNAPYCWNGIAKACTLAGALTIDVDKEFSDRCLTQAIAIARIAQNAGLVALLAPLVPSDSTPFHVIGSLSSSSPSESPEHAKRAMPTLEGCPTTMDESIESNFGVYIDIGNGITTGTGTKAGGVGGTPMGGDGDEEEDENWDMEFGIESKVEQFSLTDAAKNNTTDTLRSQPSIPTQYKMTEQLLKPLPTVMDYMRPTHLYSLKTPEGHSFIHEQEFYEWLRTLVDKQYERQYDGYKIISVQSALENHYKRLKDKQVRNPSLVTIINFFFKCTTTY